MINQFKKEYRFLSNFYPSPFKYEGYHFKTVEHFFQAYKAKKLKDFLNVINSPSPSKAKALGKLVELRENWESHKVFVMFQGLQMKFHYSNQLRLSLLSTNDHELIEGNFWHDNFWGDCFCKKCKNVTGFNVLGKLLMSVRQDLQNLKR
jgi:ribA/ribD-fused uncharacterized protein